MAAAIAPWFRLRLPSCSPWFKSQAIFSNWIIEIVLRNDENKQKEAEIDPFF